MYTAVNHAKRQLPMYLEPCMKYVHFVYLLSITQYVRNMYLKPYVSPSRTIHEIHTTHIKYVQKRIFFRYGTLFRLSG